MISIRSIQTTTYTSVQEFVQHEEFILRIGVLAGYGFELKVCHQDPVSKEISTLGTIKMDTEKFQAFFVPEHEPVGSFNCDETLIKKYLIANYDLIVPVEKV